MDIGASKIGNMGVDVNRWLQKNEEQMKTHPAWQGDISELSSEKLLKGQPLLTYLLRQGEKEHSYYISFVKGDGSIKHQRFTLELDQLGWYYRNGVTNGPREVTKENINDLIPPMMHCEPPECIPLLNTISAG